METPRRPETLRRPRKSGRLPDDLRASLTTAADGDMLVLLEGLPATVTRRSYRDASWYAFFLEKEWVRGAIAITERTLIVYAGGCLRIRTPHQHLLRDSMEVAAERPGRLCLAYDVGTSNHARKGRAEVCLRTDRAAELADLLNRLAQEGGTSST